MSHTFWPRDTCIFRINSLSSMLHYLTYVTPDLISAVVLGAVRCVSVAVRCVTGYIIRSVDCRLLHCLLIYCPTSWFRRYQTAWLLHCQMCRPLHHHLPGPLYRLMTRLLQCGVGGEVLLQCGIGGERCGIGGESCCCRVVPASDPPPPPSSGDPAGK